MGRSGIRPELTLWACQGDERCQPITDVARLHDVNGGKTRRRVGDEDVPTYALRMNGEGQHGC